MPKNKDIKMQKLKKSWQWLKSIHQYVIARHELSALSKNTRRYVVARHELSAMAKNTHRYVIARHELSALPKNFHRSNLTSIRSQDRLPRDFQSLATTFYNKIFHLVSAFALNRMDRQLRNKKIHLASAFTLAEMMVVLLILSLIMAAFLPIATTRLKTPKGSGESIWKYVTTGTDKTDIYVNDNTTQGAIIGTDAFATSEDGRLLLNTSKAEQSAILFKQMESTTPTVTGKLVVDALGDVGLGNVTLNTVSPTIGHCTALGYNASAASPYSTALGYGSTANTSTNGYNTAIGTYTKATGDYSIGIGGGTSSADATNAAGIGAIAIGYQALSYTDGSIAIGQTANAGDAATHCGTNNIAIGYQATAKDYANTGNCIAIGDQAATYLAGFSDTNNLASTGATAMGYKAYALKKYSTAIGKGAEAGHILLTDAEAITAIGSGSQADGTGSMAIGANSFAYNKDGGATAIGYKSYSYGNNSIAIGGYDTSISTFAASDYCIAVGFASQAGYFYDDSENNTTTYAGKYSTAIGYGVQAGNNAAITDAYATAVGGYDGYVYTNASAQYSTAIGNGAQASDQYTVAIGGYSNDNGTSARAYSLSSTAVGVGAIAGYSTSAGKYSTAIGGTSRAGNNSAVTDSYATAVGYSANANAQYSTAVGSYAVTATPGSTTIGAYANAGYYVGETPTDTTRGTYSTAIGYHANAGNNAALTDGYAVAIGDTAIASGYRGIAIGYKTSANGGIAIGTDSSGNGAVSVDNTITLGTANHTVYIPGSLTVNGTFSLKWIFLDTDDHFTTDANGLLSTASDRRLKNIKGLNIDGLDKIRQLKVYNYTFKKDKTKTPQVGVIAQDLQKVFPNAISKDDKGYLMIRKEDMFYAMINSIKQLDKITQEIIKDFKILAARIQIVEDKIIALTNVNQINAKKISKLEKNNKQTEKQIQIFEFYITKLEKISKK